MVRKMNEFMKAAARTYGGGDYAYLADQDEVTDDDIEVGDSLFRFVMLELSTEEDCDSLDTAIRRMTTGVRDLIDVRSALEAIK